MANDKRFKPPQHFSLISAQTGAEHNEAKHKALESDLKSQGLNPTPTKGHWKDKNGIHYNEKSYLVPHNGSEETRAKINDLAFKKYGQEAVIHSSDNTHEEVHANGKKRTGKGTVVGKNLPKPHTEVESSPYKFHLAFHGDLKKSAKGFDANEIISISPHKDYEKSVQHRVELSHDASKPHYYGRIDGVHIFHALHDSHKHLLGQHAVDPTDETLAHFKEMAQVHPALSLVIHGTPPPSLRHKAPAAEHPHGYDWHDGHTQHYDLKKTELEAAPGNTQAAGAGVKTYTPIARHYGTITPGQKTNLQFYPKMDVHEPKVDALVKEHGFQTYFAGGRHGKPDLANKNYNTKHLMVYDPTKGSGGDFGDSGYTRSWRKLHELSHALTYPQINSMYGEGRRMGSIGPRTHKEAARAVHWEWLAAHKQRELAEKLGIKISDDDFHRELNTIMHDAVHRANHGKFTEPSEEGFYPTNAKIPLEFSMKQVSDQAKKKGIHDPTVEPPAPTAGSYPELAKAFTHNDGQSQTNTQTLATVTSSLPETALNWGINNFGHMKKDDLFEIPLPGAVLKVRKVLEDLYSGWIEKDGLINHTFEKVTLPEMLQQVRSKMEAYGDKDFMKIPPVKDETMSPKAVMEKIKEFESKLGDEDSQNIKTILKQIQDRFDTPDDGKITAIQEAIDQIRNELKSLKTQQIEQDKVEVPAQDMVAGIDNPERICPACEHPSNLCICYTNLPKPRVEFDGKKFTFFFKSEWNDEDRINFVDDMKKRAGLLLEKSRLKKAEDASKTLRRKLNENS